MMILSGAYAMWYARWELRVYSGNLSTDGLVSGVDRRRAWVANYLTGIGPTGVIAITLIAVTGLLISNSLRKRYSGVETPVVDEPRTDYDIV